MAAKTAAKTAPKAKAQPVVVEPEDGGTPIALAVVLATSGLLFFRGARDSFNVPRATVSVLVAVFLLAWWAARWPSSRRPLSGLRREPAVLAAGVVLVVMALAFVLHPGWVALVGPPFRLNGLAPYLAYGVIFVAAASLDAARWRTLSAVATVVLGLAVAYGMLQVLDGDPIEWAKQIGPELPRTFSTFGQVNFASGWVAVGIPLALLVAVDLSRTVAARLAALAVVVVAAVFLATGADSFQGIVAAAVGVVPLVLLWATDVAEKKWGLAPRRVVLGLVGVAVVLLLAIAVVPKSRHYVTSNVRSGFDERVLLWQAAGDMAKDSPIVGKGFGGYARNFPEYRPTEHGRKYGSVVADGAHSVPLELLVTGGILLLLAYLGWIVLVLRSFVGGVRRGGDVLVLGLGGAFLAYLVQAFVSFDVPALAVFGWLVAGGVVAVTRLRAEATEAAPAPSRDRRSQRTSPFQPPVVIGAVVVVALVAGWFVTRPFRADVSSQHAADHIRAQQLTPAQVDLTRATDLAPWNGSYWADLTTVEQLLGRIDPAIKAGAHAIKASPGAIQYVFGEAELETVAGNIDAAYRWWQVAVRTDPNNASVWQRAGEWAGEHKPSAGSAWFAKAVSLEPANPEVVRKAVDFELAHGSKAKAKAYVERGQQLLADPHWADMLKTIDAA